MAIRALRGTNDIYGLQAQQWAACEAALRKTAVLYGFDEIRTPVIEPSALFMRTIGELSDIVQKEMFRFEDRGGNDIVLRPEGTAAVIRAFLENHLHKQRPLNKLFYMGPMFRAERPQAGRFRQFHQFGVEAIGSGSPWMDVEVIALCVELLKQCGVRELSVWVGSMGTRADQRNSAARLREVLSPLRPELPEYLQERFDKNIFRILDCKDEEVRAKVWARVDKPFLLSRESQEHFDAVRRGLEELKVPFDDSRAFARGLDYYTRTVFEVRAPGLGAQDAVAAGGRYDNLVEELGGPPLGAVGFAAGIERVFMAAEVQQKTEPALRREGVYLVVIRPEAQAWARALQRQLRGAEIKAEMDYEPRSLKAQLRDADKQAFRYAAVIGDKEMKTEQLALKDFETGTQHEVGASELVAWLQKH